MTSSLHYKFRTENVYKNLSFDGPTISAYDLKKAICQLENIKAELFDLKFTDSFSNKPYVGTDAIVRNSSVTIVRVPIQNGVKIPKISNPEITAAQVTNTDGAAIHINADQFEKMTESERIQHAIKQSTQKYSFENYKKKTTASNQPAPPDFLCNRCNKLGHFPKNCPLLNVRRTTGIPNEELMETTADDPQAMLHPSGKIVIPIMHYKAREKRRLQEEQRKLGLSSPSESTSKTDNVETPSELKCIICDNIAVDAVSAKCCDQLYCTECVQQKILEGSIDDIPFHCLKCKKRIGVDDLRESSPARRDIEKYKKNILNPLISNDLNINQKQDVVDLDKRDFLGTTVITYDPGSHNVVTTLVPQVAPTILTTVSTVAATETVVAELPTVCEQPSFESVDMPPAAQPIDSFKPIESALPPMPHKTETKHSSGLTTKSSIRSLQLDDKEQQAVDKAWAKLAVADDEINLFALFNGVDYTNKDSKEAKTSDRMEKSGESRSEKKAGEDEKRKRHRDWSPADSRSASKRRGDDKKRVDYTNKDSKEAKTSDRMEKSGESRSEKKAGEDEKRKRHRDWSPADSRSASKRRGDDKKRVDYTNKDSKEAKTSERMEKSGESRSEKKAGEDEKRKRHRDWSPADSRSASKRRGDDKKRSKKKSKSKHKRSEDRDKGVDGKRKRRHEKSAVKSGDETKKKKRRDR